MLSEVLSRLKHMEHIPREFHEQKCLYCRKELPVEQWHSVFTAEQHYKTLSCECGKKNWVKLSFDGSGHDLIFKPRPSLESVVRKVAER